MNHSNPVRAAIAGASDGFALQLRTARRAEAGSALARFAARVAGLPGTGANGPDVSPIAPLPSGPLMVVRGLDGGRDTRRQAADAVLWALDEAGLAHDCVDFPELGRLDDLDRCPGAVVLRLFPEPAGESGILPADWIDIAAEWVFGQMDVLDSVTLRVLGVAVEVPVPEAAGVLHGCAASRAWCDVVSGDFDERIRTASITFGASPHVALAAGGPACDEHGLLARFALLRDVAREFAPQVSYAACDLEADFSGLGAGFVHGGWPSEGGASATLVTGLLSDRFVPDAFPHQIIGPGHRDRLDAAIGEPVGLDRWEVSIGNPADWLPEYAVRDEIQIQGWELLRPCLLTPEEADDVLDRERSAPAGAPPPVDAARAALGAPDPATVVFDGFPHPRRGTRLTVLEMAAWLAGEVHSDAPTSVAPGLAHLVRLLGQGLRDEPRQRLGAMAEALVGTSAATDGERAWRCADWLVRSLAPVWLDAAGITESAGRLRRLPPIADRESLVRAVELLSGAMLIAGRRIDITLSIATESHGQRDELESLAWEAWERAAEASGWVAASEAASLGVKDRLVTATDLRVIDASRSRHAADGDELSAGALAEAIWASALHTVAAMAWEDAWDAADAYVRRESTFSLRVVVERSLPEAADALALHPDLADQAGEVAERLAIDALADRLLLASPTDDPLGTALDAVAAQPAGQIWRRAFNGARDVIGANVYDEAVDLLTGRLELGLEGSSPQIARTVAASVAREAASAAGRAVGLRAAAMARSRGGDEDAMLVAIEEVYEPMLATLETSALALVDELLSPAGMAASAGADDAPVVAGEPGVDADAFAEDARRVEQAT